MQNARECALISLEKCEKHQKYSNLEIDAAIDKYKLAGAEKGLYVSLVYGVIERRITLDFFISILSSKPIEKLDLRVLTALRLGLYQLIFMDKIPESAAVNESVKLANKISRTFGGFVNAVLRNFLRECGNISVRSLDEILKSGKFAENFEKLESYGKISVTHSYPVWLVKKLCLSYGEETALGIMTAQNSSGEFTLRVNTLKTSRETLIDKLIKRNIKSRPTIISPFGINIYNAPISEISDILESGEAFVQDEASQIAVSALAPKSGETLIDACACPGGKSFSSAILMNNEGKILSCDLHKSKLSLIEKGAERLGISIINVLEADSSKPKEEILNLGGADILICDVPCSGLGVIAKKPEIRYKDPRDIERLPDIQLKILENTSKYLKSGGKLLYSTCTLNPDENENNVGRFLNAHPDFKASNFKVGDKTYKNGMITLFPHIHNTDGFFISVLIKK